MGYSIFYDRRVIKVGDEYLPMVQAGSNNCSQLGWSGREVSEKRWSVMNYPRRNQWLFTKAELIELYQSDSYRHEEHKSRHSYHKDFGAWLIGGIKTAKTVEETVELGNILLMTFTINGLYHKHELRTEGELLSMLKAYSDVENLNIEFRDREYHRERRVPGPKKTVDYSEGYYVLDVGRAYLYKLTRRGYSYTPYETAAKRFKSEKEAHQYVKKNESKCKGFTPVFIAPSPQ